MPQNLLLDKATKPTAPLLATILGPTRQYWDEFFAVSIVFGDKAVSVVQKSILPKELVQQLVTAKKYMEGRGIRIEIKSRRTLKHFMRLVDIKVLS